MEIRLEHKLSIEEVAGRIASLSLEHGIEHEPASSGVSGELTKTTALGAIAARYEIEADTLVVHVTARPAFLPEEMVRRALEENLKAALGA